MTGQIRQERRKAGGTDRNGRAFPRHFRPPCTRNLRSESLVRDTKREVQAAVSTKGRRRTPEFFRSVAQLGIQAAEALEHAHQMGVVHRDIKPSNLMVDARGHLWITDFGLAMTHKDPAVDHDRRHPGHAALHESGTGPGDRRRWITARTSTRWA